MRIVGGTHRSRRINAPKNLPLRPTTDFAKESIFNILGNHFDLENMQVLDLFSGTGAISYEFASRGAGTVFSVEKNALAVSFIKKKSAEFGFGNIRVFKMDAFRFLEECREKFDIIFADPPYDLEKSGFLPDFIFSRNLLNDKGWFILEHSSKQDFSKEERFLEKRVYGEVNFSIFS